MLLPNFMSENGKTSYIEENETPNWLANNLHRLMIWVSIIWFGIVLIYISQFFRLVQSVFDDAGRVRRFSGRRYASAGNYLGRYGLY